MTTVEPLTTFSVKTEPVEVQGILVLEPTVESMKQVICSAKEKQRLLIETGADRRREVLVGLGELWTEKNASGEWDAVKEALAASTGYSRSLIEEEFNLVAQVFSRENLTATLERGLMGGAGSLDGFREIGGGEALRSLPSGPLMIISSGNSVIPPLIPTVIGLLTGNFVVLKPSLSNVLGLIMVFGLLEEVEDSETLRDCLFISYLSHTSAAYEYLLREAPLGVVNFWGSHPAVGIIGAKLGENPNHPRYLVNGPLTGYVILKEEQADDEAAKGLALNIVLYDQQLCSSPTQGAFIGSAEACMGFMKKTEAYLDHIGGEQPIKVSEASTYMLQGVRRALMMKGSKVLTGKDPNNPWTLVVSEGGSRLGEAVEFFPQFNLYNRKRFIEIIRVDKFGEALSLIADLPVNQGWKGVERVQTVGVIEVDEEEYNLLAGAGVYRVVPMKDMYLRSPSEPYDGVSLADAFTYRVYRRK